MCSRWRIDLELDFLFQQQGLGVLFFFVEGVLVRFFKPHNANSQQIICFKSACKQDMYAVLDFYINKYPVFSAYSVQIVVYRTFKDIIACFTRRTEQ